MATISRLKPGQIVWSVERRKMGNTTISEDAVFPVRVVEVDSQCRWVLASWNGNPPQKFYLKSVARWRISEPQTEQIGWATRVVRKRHPQAGDAK